MVPGIDYNKRTGKRYAQERSLPSPPSRAFLGPKLDPLFTGIDDDEEDNENFGQLKKCANT
jgi:hypothetical protein